LEAFCAQLITAHLDYLKQFNATICLISDTASHTHDGEKCMETHTLLYGQKAMLDAPQARWEWHIAPNPELHKDYDVRHQVSAWVG